MIRVGDMIYPVNNIKQIQIDWVNLSLIYYFMSELRIAPVSIKFANEGDLIEKVRELTNEPEKKPKRLFG